MRRRIRLNILLALATLLLPTSAQAHVRLLKSDPSAGSVLASSPRGFQFWFSEKIELALFKVSVVDASGRPVDIAPAAFADSTNSFVRARLVRPLRGGNYKLSWKAVAVDGHPESGTFSFRVLGSEALDTAFLTRSEPGAGAILTHTPLQFEFWFKEQIELAMAKLSIVDAARRPVAIGTPTISEKSNLLMQAEVVSPLAAGTYKVTWQVTGLDGKPKSGTYSFRILGDNEAVDTAFAAAATEAQRDTDIAVKRAEEAAKPVDVLDMRSASPVYVVIRSLSFGSLIIVAGAVAFVLLVVAPTIEVDKVTWKKIETRVASLASLAALAYIVASLLRFFFQTRLVSGNDVPELGDLTQMMLRTNWGSFWRVQVSGVVVALVGLILARWMRAGWVIAALGVLTTLVGTSLSSHAGAAEVMRAFGVINDTVHMVAISTWIGALFWLIAIGLPMASSERTARRASALVNRFSPIALVCAGVVVFTGVVSARFRVGTPSALVSSSYGQALIVKLILVAGIAAFGFYNWKKLKPTLGTDGSVEALQKSARGELIISLLVVVVTSVLVALPLPVTT